MTPSGIEPATFRFVAQYRNHCANFTTFRRDRHVWGEGVFVCVKNNIACSELWADNEFEIIAVEVKGSDPKCTWEFKLFTEPQMRH
jgi:hypothetical protein